jgi:hypothetical protein
MFALSKSPNPLARRVTHDVHVTPPFFNLGMVNLTGEIFTFFTMAYISVSSSTLAIQKFSLGKRVTPNHLCMNPRVGL